MPPDLTEAIEAAAAAMWADVDAYAVENNIDHDPVAWEHAPQDHAKECRDTARAVIEAAAPIIRAQVAEEIAQAIEIAAGLRCPECGLDTHLRSGDDFWCLNNHRWSGNRNLSTRDAAAIARNHTQAGREPADRQEKQ